MPFNSRHQGSQRLSMTWLAFALRFACHVKDWLSTRDSRVKNRSCDVAGIVRQALTLRLSGCSSSAFLWYACLTRCDNSNDQILVTQRWMDRAVGRRSRACSMIAPWLGVRDDAEGRRPSAPPPRGVTDDTDGRRQQTSQSARAQPNPAEGVRNQSGGVRWGRRAQRRAEGVPVLSPRLSRPRSD